VYKYEKQIFIKKGFKMKSLALLFLLVMGITNSFAQSRQQRHSEVLCENTSSACVRASAGYMTNREANRYCENVANNCFVDVSKDTGFYASRDMCLNVSTMCYTDLKSMGLRPQVSAIYCENINNNCYMVAKRKGLSVRASMLRCEDVTMGCRTCFSK
jgi:hypothetical protein